MIFSEILESIVLTSVLFDTSMLSTYCMVTYLGNDKAAAWLWPLLCLYLFSHSLFPVLSFMSMVRACSAIYTHGRRA